MVENEPWSRTSRGRERAVVENEPWSRTALPCPRPSLPCPRTALPCARTALPCPRTILPCSRTALPHPTTALPYLTAHPYSSPYPRTALPCSMTVLPRPGTALFGSQLDARQPAKSVTRPANIHFGGLATRPAPLVNVPGHSLTSGRRAQGLAVKGRAVTGIAAQCAPRVLPSAISLFIS